MEVESAVLEPQSDADASPEDRFANDKSVDTSVDISEQEPVEVDAETNPDAEEEVESEADSSPAGEENADETIDADDVEEKFSDNVKSRIDELTSKWRDSERQRVAMEQELEALRKNAVEAPVEVEPFKTLADFDYDEGKYQYYMASEIDRRATQAAEKVAATRDTKTAAQQAYDTFFAAEKEFAQTVAKKDYYEVINNPNLKFSTDMAQATQVEVQDPGLVYHIASNPEVAERLFNLPPGPMRIELGKIAAKLNTEKAKAKSSKKVSDAPPPPPKVKSGDQGRTKKITDANLSDAEFRKMREKQIANR